MKHHVLVLDDEAGVRAAVRLQLKEMPVEVLEAENFQQAESLLRDNALSVDVIICDVRMPGTSGVEAVQVFQREFPTTPVIVLTGFPDVGLAVDLMKKKSVVDYLTKPVEKAKLMAVVRQAAQGRRLFD